MKREDVRTVFPDATDEQLNSIMELNGKDIEREKGKAATIAAERDEAKATLETVQEEVEKLKEASASDADYKAKFEQLTADIQRKEREAAEAAAVKDREEKLDARFSAVSEGKQWTHEAVKKSYRDAFAAAVADEANAGKSDSDIFHTLVKDDAGAFRVVQGVKMPSARPDGQSDKPLPKEEILAIKNPTTRQEAMAEALRFDPNYFGTKGTKE